MGLNFLTLDQIAVRHQTDKATVFTRTYARPKGYTPHYEKFFEPLREDPIKLLEIGVGGGESVQTWLEYFEDARVFGIDVVQNNNPWNSPGAYTHPRYRFMQGDQTDKTMWACFLVECGIDWDIVIDDGSHEPKGIVTAFECMWPSLKPGGFYCVEDMGCGFANDGFPSHLDWLRSKMDGVNQGSGDIDSIYLSRELAVIKKS